MSERMVVEEASYSAAMLGVNGGVTQSSGHADSPVSVAISGGNGRATPAPS